MASCAFIQQFLLYCGWWQWTMQLGWFGFNIALMLLYVLVLCALHVNRKMHHSTRLSIACGGTTVVLCENEKEHALA